MPDTEDLEQYRAAMRGWLAANLPRREGTHLRADEVFDAEALAAGKALQKRAYDAGYFGITVPAEYGGQGLTRTHERIWLEESAAYEVPTPGGIATLVTLGLVVPVILAHGTEQQKRDWVPRMLSGEEIWCQLLSEPGAGSDLAGILTRATRDGDVWILNGSKIWTSGAMSADFGICLARTDWDVPKHQGLTWFKVPLHHDRVTVRPVREINGSEEFCEEFLDDVPIGDDMVIGEVNGGWTVANTLLAYERGAGAEHRTIPGSGESSRLAPDLVELAERRGLARDGATRQLVARGHILDFVQTQLTKRVIDEIKAGRADPTAASLIKLGIGLKEPARAAVAMEVAGRAGIAWSAGGVRSPGAPGVVGDTDAGYKVAVDFLNDRINSIAGGSNQIQRNIISERLLGLPREPSVDTGKPFRDVLRDARNWTGLTK